MESKYLKRAKEIYDKASSTTSFTIVGIMCELAEEVDTENMKFYYNQLLDHKILDSRLRKSLFTKEQVEEILLKQRDLCVDKAQRYEDDFDIDLNSILNAKLKIK